MRLREVIPQAVDLADLPPLAGGVESAIAARSPAKSLQPSPNTSSK
jgi:hypothetical protein